MKYNKHYAGELSEPDMPPNGLKAEQLAQEGTDQFIQEDSHFRTYSAYFAHPRVRKARHQHKHGHASERV
jgi:hypothetical protein